MVRPVFSLYDLHRVQPRVANFSLAFLVLHVNSQDLVVFSLVMSVGGAAVALCLFCVASVINDYYFLFCFIVQFIRQATNVM